MRRPVYPCSFVSHSHAPCPINGFYQQSGAPAALRRAPRFVFLRSPLSCPTFVPHFVCICPCLPRAGVVRPGSRSFVSLKGIAASPRVTPITRPKCALGSAPACAAYCILSARGRLSCAVPHLSRTAGVCPARACLLSVERSFLRAIPQIFFTSFTAPLPSPPRGIFFRRVSAPRVPVLLVTFYPLVRL